MYINPPPLSIFKECQQQQEQQEQQKQQKRKKKTGTLMGETCVYLYFDGYIWFELSCYAECGTIIEFTME
jgi:hypothetical protein